MNKVNITIPKAIWSGDPQRYSRWCWETYGRYIQGQGQKGDTGNPPVELNIKLARW